MIAARPHADAFAGVYCRRHRALPAAVPPHFVIALLAETAVTSLDTAWLRSVRTLGHSNAVAAPTRWLRQRRFLHRIFSIFMAIRTPVGAVFPHRNALIVQGLRRLRLGTMVYDPVR